MWKQKYHSGQDRHDHLTKWRVKRSPKNCKKIVGKLVNSNST